MPITINVNGLTLCHRGSGGVSHNTLPDVCKTPDKGTPVAYENEAYSRDLVRGTTTVFADGGHSIATYGSRFARSVFDEPGSMGGIVSGTYKDEAEWITHSFDVFIEGRPACRLTDKMFMNRRNTVNLAGLMQVSLEAWGELMILCAYVCKCDEQPTPSASGESDLKEQCVENALLMEDTAMNGQSPFKPEIPYNMTTPPPRPFSAGRCLTSICCVPPASCPGACGRWGCARPGPTAVRTMCASRMW